MVNNCFFNLEISLSKIQILEHSWWNLEVFFEVVPSFFLKFDDILMEVWWHFGGSLVEV